jgi:hypothetical protein
MDRERLLDELARCFARAAVDAFVAAQNGTAQGTTNSLGGNFNDTESTTHEQYAIASDAASRSSAS